MRASTAVTLTGMFRAADPNKTVVGAEELTLQVSADGTITSVNEPMARLLGIANREWARGLPLDRHDDGPLGFRTLATLVALAQQSGQPQLIERPFPDVRPELLPPGGGPHPEIAPILRITVTVSVGVAHVVVHDVTRLRWLESMFSRYVPSKVIEEMQGVASRDFLSMQRRELTILFSDLRGFTALSESLEPEAVGELVSSYLGNMVGVVEGFGGTIDKFIGDSVMAIFGAPVPSEGHALRALSAAMKMQQAHARWVADRTRDGLPAPPMGVGLASGEVVVGNVGTKVRAEYTVLGHAVNLAARLCGAAQGGEILTTRATRLAAMEAVKKHTGQEDLRLPGLRSLGEMRFKNVAAPVEVVSLRGA